MSFVQSLECRDFIIFDNFNSALHVEKHWEINGFGSVTDELVNFVDSLNLHDVPFRGSSFIFFGSSDNVARSKISRFLVSDEAGSWFSNLVQRVFLRFLSYHIPITVFSGVMPSGHRLFRLFNV